MIDVFLMVNIHRSELDHGDPDSWFPIYCSRADRAEILRLGLCSKDCTYPHLYGLRLPTARERRLARVAGKSVDMAYMNTPFFNFPRDKYGFRILDPGQYQIINPASYGEIYRGLLHLFSDDFAESMKKNFHANGYMNHLLVRWLSEIELLVKYTLQDRIREIDIAGKYTQSGNSVAFPISSDWFEVRSDI
ncbi:MAG: hypothetical protein KAH38_12220 [Candidatus Hydrogenedentes bacterium]|nr:hypothetical protein [Candidatus Hydrogenedentota bacterium]